MGMWVITCPETGAQERIRTRPGRTPSADGSNPQGWGESKVGRFGSDEERFDPETRRWRRCERQCAAIEAGRHARAQAWIDRLPPGVMELIVEAVAAKLETKAHEGDGNG